jgi:outer membrane lipoprotein LolB
VTLRTGTTTRRWAAPLIAAAVLTGCASLPGPDAALGLAASGRLAVRVEAPDGPRASTAQFELLGEPRQGELRLASPLGTVLAVARWQPGQAWVQAQGERRDYASLDELTRDLMGEALPVEALFDWLQARPWPGASSQARSDGLGFVQLGWTVSLEGAADGLIVARRSTPTPVTVRAKVDAR